MSRPPLIPDQLTHGPFTVVQALAAGLSRRQLQGASWKRLSTGHYIWAQLPDDPRHLLQVLQSSLPPEAAFSDRTAGWLLGLDLQPCQPAVVTVPDGLGSWSRPGVYVRRSALPRSDVLECQGLPTTSPLRTVFDLARHLPITEAVVAVDMAFHQALVRLQTVRLYVAEHRTSKGYAQARRVVDLAEPRAESQMETRLRMLLVHAGLPRPEVQVDVSDEQGRFLGRLDLCYPAHRLGIEYDGETHRESLVEDNRRQNRLLAAGFRLLRFTGGDVYRRSETVVGQVRAALDRSS